MRSPWDDDPKDAIPDPVSDDLDDLADFTSETWQRRAHDLWLQAVRDGDLRAQASALQVAFRGLKDRHDSEAKKAASAGSSGASEQLVREIQVAVLDHAVAGVEEYHRKYRTLCPCCHSQGDKLRIHRFEKWLAEHDGRAADFASWDKRTPYAMSGTLEHSGGLYAADEVSDSKPN